MTEWNADDERHMRLALQLARRGQGLVEPNPMVGCVLVRSGRIVGRGHHERYGGPHAEVHALRRAGLQARGATAYVTLEPCSHFGKTPPCADALIAAGVAEVVAAMRDPNPLVAGRGLRKLRAAGVRTRVGLLRDEAARLNAPFIRYIVDQRPYVILKWAQSIDGKIATRTGDSRWISGVDSRRLAHALRARVDGIVVGVGTVVADDPILTAREVPPRRIAARIVLDPRLRIPPNCRLVRTAAKVPTLIAAGPVAFASRRRKRLERAGCTVLAVRTRGRPAAAVPHRSPRPNRTRVAAAEAFDLRDLLSQLRSRNMTNIMVEGGGRTLGAFLDQGLADELMVFVAPKIIGGQDAPGPLMGTGPGRLHERVEILECGAQPVGGDLCYSIRLGRRQAPPGC